MTNKFWQETKEIISEFIYETKGYAAWAKREIIRQYHLSILKEIGEAYPETTLHINKAYEIIDGVPLDCPDFVEAPERTNIDSKCKFNFETKDESDVSQFAEKLQELKQNREIANDGLNEPRYPYDNEPSA